MPVPVAESMLKLNTAASACASATTGGTFITMLCRPGIGSLAMKIPSKNALNWGVPQTNTNTDRMIQGVHALITAGREVTSTGCSCGSSTTSLDDQSRGVSVMGCAGRQIRKKSARHSMDEMAATMSTSQGPWK